MVHPSVGILIRMKKCECVISLVHWAVAKTLLGVFFKHKCAVKVCVMVVPTVFIHMIFLCSR